MSEIFYVTALFLPSGEPYRPLNKYIEHFHELAKANIQIGVYLDPRLKDLSSTIVRDFKNVRVLDYVAVDREFLPHSIELPSHRNNSKDTIDYFLIQLMKLNLCARAAADSRITASCIAWIDFGIFHMIKDKKRCQEFLSSYKLPTHISRILNPGCWNSGTYAIWDSIIWRYCGSLLIGPRNAWHAAYELQQRVVLSGLPRLTWEVNYWTEMDIFEWYKADHNDSILLNLPMA
jgi:hypothetical protein